MRPAAPPATLPFRYAAAMGSEPYLLLDCYVDDVGCAHLFQPLPRDAPAVVARPSKGDCPDTTRDYAGVIVSGSAASALEGAEWMERVAALVRDAERRRQPVLGVCFGHQLVAHALLGPGAVRRSPTPELGWADVEVLAADPLLAGFERRFRPFLSHFDEVLPLEGLDVLARSERCAVQAYRVSGRPIWGVQFHVEMDDAETERLVRVRSAELPELELDAGELLAARVDCAPLMERMMKNFLAVS